MSDRIEDRLDDWLEHLYGIYGPTLRGQDIETLKEAAGRLREMREALQMIAGRNDCTLCRPCECLDEAEREARAALHEEP